MIKTPKSLGNFVLRVPPELHTSLKERAVKAGLSLNEYCTRVLTSGSADAAPHFTFANELVSRALKTLGDTLVGVIVYGSWIRGEARDSSDIDVLIVVNDFKAIKRSLIAQWDEQPMSHGDRPIEVQFAALPMARSSGGPNQSSDQDISPPVSGLWAEISIDGMVLFERDLAISRYLSFARAEIADGRLQRRHSHGQNYWVHVEGGAV